MPTQIQIYASYDNSVLDHYDVKTWEGPDLNEVITPYSIKDAQAKFGSLLDPNAVGTPTIPDRVFLIFNDDGTLLKIDAQVTSQSSDSFKGKITEGDQLDSKLEADAESTSSDVTEKTSGSNTTPPDKSPPQ